MQGHDNMDIFKFHKKQNALVHININAPSLVTEKVQLIDQDFEQIGAFVQTESAHVTLNYFKPTHIEALKQFANSHLFMNTSLI